MSGRRAVIPISKPWLGEEEAAAARRAILSGWVTQGAEVAALEQELAEYLGAPLACAVSSGTAALHVALAALGVGRGDEVVTVSHSFIATANAIRSCGARPVFVDIDPQTGNLDSTLIGDALSPRTAAILAVHQLGQPCDIQSICEIAARRNIPVVEDAACAIGSEVHIGRSWQRIGRSHGTIACFSFHPRKLLTTGEGGLLTTADPALDQKFRLLRQHGMSISDAVRHAADDVLFEKYQTVGFNYRMTDIQAAVGRVQLGRLDEMLRRRRELTSRYAEAMQAIPGLEPPGVAEFARPNWQSFSVRVGREFSRSRDELMQHLLRRGISTRRGVMNAHQEQAYADLGPFHLPHSEAARDRSLLLPLYPTLSDDEQAYIIEQLHDLARQGSNRFARSDRGS